MTPYIVGRRESAVDPVPGASLRAEDSGSDTVLRTWGWSAATFGAGTVLGWMISAKKASRTVKAGS
ncbi:hypothetical protein [Thiomonas sp.]